MSDRPLVDILPNQRILAALLPQGLDIIRIGQEPDIERHVRIERNPVFEPE